MAKFIPLEVTHIEADTRHAVIVTLKPPKEYAEMFRYTQGQYLTFKKFFEDEELRRSYSICSSVKDNCLKVGIKRVEGGWFSSWANAELKVGDKIDTLRPNGRFFTPLEPKNAKSYLMFAIGSGITPIMSLVKTILETEPLSSITLVYGNSAGNTIMFKESLNDLKDTYMERFSLLHILSRDQGDIDLFCGRIDSEKCNRLFSNWLAPKTIDLAFICGPKSVTLMIAERLQAHGMDKTSIKFELFESPPPKKARHIRNIGVTDGADVKATIILDGQARTLTMPKNGMSVLEAAIDSDIDVPFSCQAGVCSTCSAKVIKGEVEMQTNYGLEDYEVERGLVLTCQAYPVNDEIVIDYNQH